MRTQFVFNQKILESGPKFFPAFINRPEKGILKQAGELFNPVA
jgi:hypothetical protein